MPNGLFLVGGQIGLNYQFWGGVVIGMEADFDWLPKTMALAAAPHCSSTLRASGPVARARLRLAISG